MQRRPVASLSAFVVAGKAKVGDFDLGHVEGASPPLSDLCIGAHRKGGNRYEGVGAPFGHRLCHQGQGGHQVQDVAAFTGQFLRDPQAGQGLSGAARHDELAAVGSLQSAHVVSSSAST